MDRFEDRYEELHVVAFRAARRVLGGGSDAAADVAAETVARAYSRWRKVEPYARAWVTRVAVNLAIDTVRRHQPPLSADRVDDPPSEERLEMVEQLGRLPRRQRQALALRYLLDLDEDTAAATLGVSVATLHTHVTRGLARLRVDYPLALGED